MPAREGVLNKIIVVIRVISDVIERDLFNPINLLNEPGLIFYVVLKSQQPLRGLKGVCFQGKVWEFFILFSWVGQIGSRHTVSYVHSWTVFVLNVLVETL